jgi:cytochrome c peroxidase
MGAICHGLLFIAMLIVGHQYAIAGELLAPTSNLMLGLPRGDVAAGSKQQLELGRMLYFDTRLSRDRTVGCVSCHDPTQAFTDGRPVSIGTDHLRGTRNAPSLINVAYAASLMWDGRRATLEEQVAGPFTNVREHALETPEQLLRTILASEDYRWELAAAFPDALDHWEPSHLFRALASYLRTLRAGDSRFDRYYFGGIRTALSEPERRGFELFRGRALCAQCHTIHDDSALFTDNDFHRVTSSNITTANLAADTRKIMAIPAASLDAAISADPVLSALGRFLVTRNPRDIGKYRTPSLRNVALTAPYMHDGSVKTLAEAVDLELYYRSNELGRPIILTPLERDDLVGFLRTLTSSCVEQRSCPFSNDEALSTRPSTRPQER